ncbi:LOW QUALITY PROTEIN: hypothetical protein SETIT_8G184800v2 [Setaria italica]|uniref:Uncharacterized protein n=1 Tax=Setaria italica TaxID=4555 RepID=A0A368S945_SETIT|nr:LOW QUALITY PROTEIN: hypothetical protein SETIT_8G184800v2 [Setaria italica]
MEAAKNSAVADFCRVAGQAREVVRRRIGKLAETIRNCYDIGDKKLTSIDDGELSEMMMLDDCFLLYSWTRSSPHDSPVAREDLVDTRMSAIARDILLLENQIPWVVPQALMESGKLDSNKIVSEFLDRMATAFHVGNRISTKTSPPPRGRESPRMMSEPARGGHEGARASHTFWKLHWSKRGGRREEEEEEEEQNDGNVEEEGKEEPIISLTYRHQVGEARIQGACLCILLSHGVVELAEMRVKLTAIKTKKFGDMEMKKHRWPLGLFGELSLAPVALNELTACWLINMVAYEAFLGATQADNFAVSSYIFLVAHLINREEDVRDLHARGIISSAMSDGETLHFFKSAAPSLRIGDRYIQISKRIHEYKQERWIWIAIHRFLYDNIKVIVAVVSVVGVLTGLFKTMLSLRQPQR